MESWKERMYDALAEMLRDEYSLDAAKVTGFEEYTYSSGYCDTCYYETTKCRIDYVDSKGNVREYDYYGSFAELISALS